VLQNAAGLAIDEYYASNGAQAATDLAGTLDPAADPLNLRGIVHVAGANTSFRQS
jgi:hypothetical protein